MGTLSILASQSAFIWDTVNYTNGTTDNFEQVLAGIATFNQEIGAGNLVMVVNTVDQSSSDAFAQFLEMVVAFQEAAIKDRFSILRLESEEVYGLSGIATYTLPGLFDPDGYTKLSNLDDIAINAHLISTSNPHSVTTTQIGAATTSHASTHEPGGSDTLTVDATPGVGSLRTLGSGSQQACAGNDARLSDARTPTAHASSHSDGGSDEIVVDNLAASSSNTNLVLKPDGAGGVTWGVETGGVPDLDGYVVAPGSVIDNGIVRFDGTSGRFIQDGYVTIDDNGNFYLDADGSSVGVPRIFGTINFSETGESIQWQFGDTANVIQNSYGGSMTLRAYHTIVLRGDNSNTSTSWDTDSNIGVLVDNTATTSPALVVRGASNQSGALQQWRDSGDGVLASITADGYLNLNNHDAQAIRTATFNGLITGSGSGGVINWPAGQKQQFTMSGTGTLTFTAPAGPCNLMLKLINGGAYTITWPAAVDWAGGAEPSWTSSGTDIVAFFYDGTTYYGVASLNFS